MSRTVCFRRRGFLTRLSSHRLGRRGRFLTCPYFTANIVLDSAIITGYGASLSLSRRVLTNVFYDRQGGLKTRPYRSLR